MSLDTLSRIGQALGVSMSQLFRDYELPAGGAQLVKAAEGMEGVRRGTKRGHTYHLLAYDKGPRKSFEPFLVTMDDGSCCLRRLQAPRLLSVRPNSRWRTTSRSSSSVSHLDPTRSVVYHALFDLGRRRATHS